MAKDERKIRELEETIEKFLSPIKDVPLRIVIKALTKHEIIAFDTNNQYDKFLLAKLIEGMQRACKAAYDTGIFTKRPNEVGNHIEPFVRSALNAIGVRATTPFTVHGGQKSAGYPDIEIKFQDKISYLECKTYNIDNVDSSLRAFYLQPSENTKITVDAHHLLVGFQIETVTRNGEDAYVPVSWKLYSLHDLKVQVKHEFNASNYDLYETSEPLAEGKISSS